MKTLRIIVAISIIGFCYGMAYKVVFGHEAMVSRTGVVTWKGDRMQVNKHSSSTEFILVVEYEKKVKQTETVSAATWSSYDVGNTITLVSERNNLWDLIQKIIGGLTVIVTAIAVVLLSIFGLMEFFGVPVFKYLS